MANGTAGAREAALYVLARCRRFDAWSQQTIQTAAEKFSLDERDTALCTKLCLDVLQNAALCDYYIGCYSSVPAAKLEPNLLDILRLGVCQLLFMDKIPVSAAVNEAVEQTKRSGSRAAGLVNAVLRRVAENRENLPEIPNIGTAQELSVRFSHPLWLCERMVSELGYDGAHAFFSANNRAPQLTVLWSFFPRRAFARMSASFPPCPCAWRIKAALPRSPALLRASSLCRMLPQR